MNDCLLFQLARSFRKRLFRLWEKIIESDRITISSTTVMQQQTGGSGGESNILSTSLQSDHAIEVDEDAPYMKYIEPLAFRVPAPVCSAGTALYFILYDYLYIHIQFKSSYDVNMYVC